MNFSLLEPISVHGFSADLLREMREELTLHPMQTWKQAWVYDPRGRFRLSLYTSWHERICNYAGRACTPSQRSELGVTQTWSRESTWPHVQRENSLLSTSVSWSFTRNWGNLFRYVLLYWLRSPSQDHQVALHHGTTRLLGAYKTSLILQLSVTSLAGVWPELFHSSDECWK